MRFTTSLLSTCLLLAPALPAQTPAAATAQAAPAPGVPFTAAQLSALLPPSVYFQGKTASLQLRNAGGVDFPGNAVLWAALVDTSGYSTAVQEKYQFYLVTEAPVSFGGKPLPAGAYGCGFVGDSFVVMDVGGHTLLQGPLETDTALKRPRPLQLVSDGQDAVRLYLGRHWVRIVHRAS